MAVSTPYWNTHCNFVMTLKLGDFFVLNRLYLQILYFIDYYYCLNTLSKPLFHIDINTVYNKHIKCIISGKLCLISAETLWIWVFTFFTYLGQKNLRSEYPSLPCLQFKNILVCQIIVNLEVIFTIICFFSKDYQYLAVGLVIMFH